MALRPARTGRHRHAPAWAAVVVGLAVAGCGAGVQGPAAPAAPPAAGGAAVPPAATAAPPLVPVVTPSATAPSTRPSARTARTADSGGTRSAEPSRTPSAGPAPTRLPRRSAKKGATLWAFPGARRAVRDSGISWYYTWSTDRQDLPRLPGATFVPMVWGAGSVTDENLAAVRRSGSDVLLGFNEPDLAEQANLSVEQALDLWPRLEATGARLVSPAVASQGDVPGRWLDRFMSGARTRGHRVDAVAVHWYGGDFDPARATEQLRAYLVAVHDRYRKPVWLTEFALMRFGPVATPDAATQAAFVRRSTRMLEALPFVERYAWFSFATPREGGLGTGLYRPGGTRTRLGAAYRRAG